MVDVVQQLKSWARTLKRDVVALWIAARDKRTPVLAKLTAGAVAAYALSPIDLIPDFVPVLGYLDDLLIIPAGVALAIRLVPAPLMAVFRDEAAARLERPRSVGAAAVIVAAWVILALVLALWVWRMLR